MLILQQIYNEVCANIKTNSNKTYYEMPPIYVQMQYRTIKVKIILQIGDF